ncbi:MAG: NADH:ubiquinone oxidoreductase [Desulfobulbaceae bacterium]|nr:MAG: NADH:ubiquinone oxidoreductase [Desulfobulbaceae bacterium]
MKDDERTYLGVAVPRPPVAFFELSSCEGCQLQLFNNEAGLLDFLDLVEIVNFREAMTEKSDHYQIAFVEGSVTRTDEEERLRTIRDNAELVVALGSCACFGGVNQLKNRFNDLDWVVREVYGDYAISSQAARPLADVIRVDLEIFGCPVKKEEVERIVTNLVLGKPVHHPQYPICMECKARENVCLFDLGEPCLGPVTRAGCDAWCPSNRLGCWGCRGPAPAANMAELRDIVVRKQISLERLLDRLECFGGFADEAHILRQELEGRS